MSKRHCPEVYDPAQGKRPRQLIGGLDYPISEKSEKPSRERGYTPPRQCQTDCSSTESRDLHKEWLAHKPLVIPEVTCLGIHSQKRDYSPPLSKSDSYTSHEGGDPRAKHPHYNQHQQLSVSSTDSPLSVPVPRPPSQPTMEPPKKGHTLVHMDSRIESSKTGPASRVVVSSQDQEDNTRYSTPSDTVHHSNSPDRTWAQRWPKSQKWLELNHMCRAITSGHNKTYHSLSKHIANILQSTREKAAKSSSTHPSHTNHDLTKAQILERLNKHMAEQWGKIAQFAESIPGFESFSKDDQGILLQIGGLEVILLQLAQMYDRQTHLIQMWDGQWISSDEALKLSKSAEATDFNLAVFFELLFGLAESLSTMHLRDEDLAIFSALLLLASDHQGLRHKMQVEELQEKVLNCFAYILAQNHVQEPGLLAQVLMCMPTLRTISTSYLELTSSSSPTQQWGSWPLEL